jgi:thiosulfate/3-mercaptopyruvate sulfurtransferase
MPTIIDPPAASTALVAAHWVASRLDDPAVRVVEVDVSPATYDQGHIPGAILWNAYADLRHPDYTTIGTRELEQLFGRTGLRPSTTLAFYGYAAHLGYWLVRVHGHFRAVLLDEPRDHWTGPWSMETRAPTPARYDLGPATGLLTGDDLLAFDRVVLDVRSEGEYAGERFWPSGAPEERGRPGHVPGALNLPISELRGDSGFKPIAELHAAVSRRGLTRDQRVAVYCTIGNRASQAWFALTNLLGFADVAVYYGGWAEWGFDLSLPIER